jgi:hypothetical protein
MYYDDGAQYIECSLSGVDSTRRKFEPCIYKALKLCQYLDFDTASTSLQRCQYDEYNLNFSTFQVQGIISQIWESQDVILYSLFSSKCK